MDFKKIELKDKKIFDEYFSNHDFNISEFTFTNLYSWRKNKAIEWAEYKNHLVISFIENGKRHFYQPVGKNPLKIKREILEKYPGAAIERVEKGHAEKLNEFNVEEQPHMHDYVYLLEELRELKGRKFEPKRNFVKQVQKIGPNVCILNDETVEDFTRHQKEWCKLKSCDCNESLKKENEAVLEALNNYKEFNLHGICVKKDEKVIGFAIGEKLNENTFVEHFEKGNTDFKGIYQYLLWEFAKSIPSRFKYLNREQDLGVEGIRKSKKSYNPVHMVEKFRVSKR